MRMIVYARKAKEICDREAVEATTHWGNDLNSTSEIPKGPQA